MEGRVVEYVDHLHEHFISPLVIQNGCYMPPEAPGYSCEMKEESLQQYEFPDGAVWQRLRNQS